MLQLIKANLPNRFFNISATLFWLAVHAIYAHLQYRAFSETERAHGWLSGWVELSTWFIPYILITILVYAFTKIIERAGVSLSKRVMLHILVMVALMVPHWLVATFFFFLITGREFDQFFSYIYQMLATIQLDILIYVVILSVCLGLCFRDNRLQEKLDMKLLQTALIEEQLKTLRSQLNPHFLFNALNTVVSLVRLKRNDQAIDALAQLSSMLRKILENKNGGDTKIKDEVDFINNYLSIQQMRFADKLDINIHVEDSCLDLRIPNMLLHPLVENAVQHGSQLESNRNLLNLDISREEDVLMVKMTNKVAQNNPHQGFGIGVANTRERLSKIYNNYRLELKPSIDGLFETTLAIPIGERNA